LCLCDVPELISRAKDDLQKLQDIHDGNNDDVSSAMKNYKTLHVTLGRLGFPTSDTAYSQSFHNDVGKPFIRAVVSNIECRLAQAPVLAAFGVFDARNTEVYKGDGTFDIAVAETQLERLITHFTDVGSKRRVVDNVTYEPAGPYWSQEVCAQMRKELRHVLIEVNTNRQECRGFGESARCLLTCSRMPVLYKSFSRLLKIGLCLPIGTASVERVFS